jgi:hypothetical protein
MVALSVLVFRRNLDPNGKAYYGYMDPKTSRKTSITRGERLSAIFVPFSGKICIYNHDKKDYGMDKFKYQHFDTNDRSFKEPLSILWKEYSLYFPPEQVEALVQEIEEDYTTIFRLNDRTFKLIRESDIKLSMSVVKSRCEDLKGSDDFRAHVYREVLCRIIQAGAEKLPGPTGYDGVFDVLSERGKYPRKALPFLVEIDEKTNLLGIKAHHIRTHDAIDHEEVYAYIRLSYNRYLTLNGRDSRNYGVGILHHREVEAQPGLLENIIV